MKTLLVSRYDNNFCPSLLASPPRKMATIPSRLWPFALLPIVFVALCGFSDCYDPLDPNGNIIVTFDIHQWTIDGYVARVTIQNYYQYRHVDKPGWTWAMNEVIWSMSGAFAAKQGNCSSFKFQIPHSCKKDPAIVDLMPEASPENGSEDCCRGLITMFRPDREGNLNTL